MPQEGAEKRKVGRPTDYSEEILIKSKDYLENFRKLGDQIPSLCSLSLHLGFSRECLRHWGKDPEKAEFSAILEGIQSKQQAVLINQGLDGSFNSSIAKLVLGKHGYHDKMDQEHTGGGGGPIEGRWKIEVVKAKDEKELDK